MSVYERVCTREQMYRPVQMPLVFLLPAVVECLNSSKRDSALGEITVIIASHRWGILVLQQQKLRTSAGMGVRSRCVGMDATTSPMKDEMLFLVCFW